MYGAELVYVAHPVAKPNGQTRVRITTTLEGPHAEFREHKPADVATLTLDQARRLRDDLDEVLDDGA